MRPGVIAGALLLVPLPAPAEEVSGANVSLEWQAPPSCPSGRNVLDRVKELIKAQATEHVRARGIVTAPAGEPWRLTFETVQGTRTFDRTLQAGSCEELADAGALIIALVLDPSLQTAGSGVENSVAPKQPPPPPVKASAAPTNAPAAPSTVPPPPPAPPPATAGPRPSSASRDTELGAHGAASVIGDWGSMPRVALGAEIAAGVSIAPIEFELSGLILPEVREEIAPGRGGEIELIAGGLRSCYEWDTTPVSGRVCAGLEAGRIQGTGFGTGENGWTDQRNELWFAGRLGVFGRYPLVEPLVMRFGVEGLVPANRPEFELVNVDTVHQPNVVVLRLALGLELLFR